MFNAFHSQRFNWPSTSSPHVEIEKEPKCSNRIQLSLETQKAFWISTASRITHHTTAMSIRGAIGKKEPGTETRAFTITSPCSDCSACVFNVHERWTLLLEMVNSRYTVMDIRRHCSSISSRSKMQNKVQCVGAWINPHGAHSVCIVYFLFACICAHAENFHWTELNAKKNKYNWEIVGKIDAVNFFFFKFYFSFVRMTFISCLCPCWHESDINSQLNVTTMEMNANEENPTKGFGPLWFLYLEYGCSTHAAAADSDTKTKYVSRSKTAHINCIIE